MKALVIAILFIASFISAHAYAQELTINVLNFSRATNSDKVRVYEALRLISKVVNSEEFRNNILDMTYKVGKKTYSGFAQTRKTTDEVLRSILEAEENFKGGQLGVIDLYMKMYYERCNIFKCVVGYTSQSDKYFHMNRYLQRNYSPAKTAGNIVHEWLHKIGHGHTKRSNSFRPHSVPYKIGNLIAKMAAKIAAEENPNQKMSPESRFAFDEEQCTH